MRARVRRQCRRRRGRRCAGRGGDVGANGFARQSETSVPAASRRCSSCSRWSSTTTLGARTRARVDGKVEDVDADVASARAGVAGVAGVIFPAIARPSANASEDAARRVVIASEPASNASTASNASCSRAPASLANASEDARRRARSGSARRDATSRETLLRKDHRHCLYIRRVDTTARNPARARPSLVVAVARANDPPRAVGRASVHARVRRPRTRPRVPLARLGRSKRAPRERFEKMTAASSATSATLAARASGAFGGKSARTIRSRPVSVSRPRAARRDSHVRACGIIGVVTREKSRGVATELYEGLLMLQHRGQDSAGMVTYDGDRFKERKDNGLVKDVFDKSAMKYLDGHIGMGHVRHPTAGGLSATEAQPFFVNQPLGIYLIHNGNLTNTEHLRDHELNNRHLRTGSDSEVLLNVFAEDLSKEIVANPDKDSDKQLFDAVTVTMGKVKGAYSVISLINGQGMFAFRDPNGIRPLVLGQRQNANGEDEWCVASEDAAFGPLGFQIVRDVNPGEAILITDEGKMISRQCMKGSISPCIFEYIYLARPDSQINGISVYEFQLELGRRLAKRINERGWEIDTIVPCPMDRVRAPSRWLPRSSCRTARAW